MSGGEHFLNFQLLSATMYASCRRAVLISFFLSYQSYLLHRPVPTEKIKQFIALASLNRTFTQSHLIYRSWKCFLHLFLDILKGKETRKLEFTQFSRSNNKWSILPRWCAEYKYKDLSIDEDTDSPRSKELHRAPSAMGAAAREPWRWKNGSIN